MSHWATPFQLLRPPRMQNSIESSATVQRLWRRFRRPPAESGPPGSHSNNLSKVSGKGLAGDAGWSLVLPFSRWLLVKAILACQRSGSTYSLSLNRVSIRQLDVLAVCEKNQCLYRGKLTNFWSHNCHVLLCQDEKTAAPHSVKAGWGLKLPGLNARERQTELGQRKAWSALHHQAEPRWKVLHENIEQSG